MTFRRSLCLAALVAGALVVPQAARAGNFLKSSVYTRNLSSSSIWITIYDITKRRHMDYGCVEAATTRSGPASYREWRSGAYTWGGFYYVRAEVKAGPSCGGRTLCDTTVQINPQHNPAGGSFGGIFTGLRNAVSLNWSGKGCYWDRDNWSIK
jgi:hypothetical protein